MSKYDDIIGLERPISKRKKMSMESRAAQFAPFSALTGYEDAIKEKARSVDAKKEISEEEKMMLDLKLDVIEKNINDNPNVLLTHFLKDKNKEGGEYIRTSGIIKRIDKDSGKLILQNKEEINIEDIIDIESTLFSFINW